MSGSLIRNFTVREKKFKVAIIGAEGVGKSALTVRAKTQKFIHSYAPNMELKCSFTTVVEGETVTIEVIDTPALHTAENAKLEEKIKWADAFILMYSVTDHSSMADLLGAKFLLNLYAKRRRITPAGTSVPDLVALVGNKNDLEHERMISEEEGRLSAEVNDCTHFFELSTRESYEAVKTVFDSLYKSFLVKPAKHSPNPPQKTLSSAVRIPSTKRRERSTTPCITGLTGIDFETRMSPVTFRKIRDDCSVCSSSPDEESRFIAEQIVDRREELSSQNCRRITVCTSSPPSTKSPKLRMKGKTKRSATIGSDYFRSDESHRHDDLNNNGTERSKQAVF